MGGLEDAFWLIDDAAASSRKRARGRNDHHQKLYFFFFFFSLSLSLFSRLSSTIDWPHDRQNNTN